MCGSMKSLSSNDICPSPVLSLYILHQTWNNYTDSKLCALISVASLNLICPLHSIKCTQPTVFTVPRLISPLAGQI